MTLKTRNRITNFFLAYSILCLLLTIAYIIAAIISNSSYPITSVRVPEFLNSLAITPVSIVATFISIFMLFAYVPIMLLVIKTYFQNTQASEIIFFYGFLLSCLTEGVRLIIPFFDVSNSFSDLFLFLSRILFVGRILGPLSFIFSALMSSTNMRHDIERNFFALIAIPCIFALIIPVNTAYISTTFEATYGFAKIFNITRFTIIIFTYISFIIESYNQDNPDLKTIGHYYLMLIIGYLTLTISDNYCLLTIGATLFAFGTYRYMRVLHTIHMWK